jgi:hypothetical protein
VNLPELLAEAGGDSDPATLRRALASDPALFGQILARISHDLPFRMVTVVDQAEELFTLGQPEEAQQGLAMLHGAVAVPGDFQLILSLHSQYLDQFVAALSDSETDDRIHDVSLQPLDEAAVTQAIKSPCAVGKWPFSFGPGVAEQLAERLVSLQAATNRCTLPETQSLCQQLYDQMQRQQRSKIMQQDVEEYGSFSQVMQRYVDDNLANVLQDVEQAANDHGALSDLFSRLLHNTPEGQQVAAIVSELTESLVERQLVRRTRARIGPDLSVFLSLWHDRLVAPLGEWIERHGGQNHV